MGILSGPKPQILDVRHGGSTPVLDMGDTSTVAQNGQIPQEVKRPMSCEDAMELRDEAMRALVTSLEHCQATAPTWCPGWSAHEIAAHVAAAAQERSEIIEEHVPGQSDRPTRGWAEREAPFRAQPHRTLLRSLRTEAARFERAVARLNEGDSVVYTGWDVTAERLRTHSHSEAALHRWDLVGDDETSVRLLSDPALTKHALAAFEALPALLEAQRWAQTPFSGRLRLRCTHQPDVLVEPGRGLSLTAPHDTGDLVIEVEPHERLPMLWGRCPASLRSPTENAETLDDVLRGLADGSRTAGPRPMSRAKPGSTE